MPSQRDRILDALQANPSWGVCSVTMMKHMHIMRGAARIQELRDRGHEIRTEVCDKHFGAAHGRYFLVVEPEQGSLDFAMPR